jgi:nucleoside-diphosphate-sugar epimerase
VARIDGDTEWESLLEGIDAVIHLAARVHRLHDTATDPEDAYRQVNTVGTLRLAEAAAAAGCRRFVFFSTVKVLGEGGAFDGNAAGRSPEDPYGRSKFEAEVGLRNLSASTGMEVVCIRPPLVYGPGVKANFLRLMNWVHRGVPLPLSSVENRRSLVYVGNLVDAAIRCLSSERIPGFAYSVTDGEDISTANLIRSIAGAMGKSATLFPCPVGLLRCAGTIAGKGAEVRRLTESLTVSDAAFRRDFGWTPPFTMQEGIQETVNWFLSNRR